MGLLDKIKSFFSKIFQQQPQLRENNKTSEQLKQDKGKDDVRSRVNAKAITNLYDKYEVLQNSIKNSENQEDYLGEFYDTLIEICGANPEHSYERFQELNDEIKELNQNMLLVYKGFRERQEDFFNSKKYKDIQKEYEQILDKKRVIQGTWEKCIAQMEEEYQEDPAKYEEAKDLLDKAVESNNSTKRALAKKLGLEYAFLLRVSNDGKLSSEQTKKIQLALGKKPGAEKISEYVEARKKSIEGKLEDPATLISTSLDLEPVESLINDEAIITDEEVREIFEDSKDKTTEELPDVGFESVERLYSIKNDVFGLEEEQDRGLSLEKDGESETIDEGSQR